MTRYEEKKAQLLDALAADRANGGAGAGLAKATSNLFRDRAPRPRPRIDLSRFNEVVRVDRAAGTVEAEGMTTFADLVDATLAHGAMPRVVPQLKSITLGGAVAGVGIEASSFRYGLVHDTIASMEVLTGDGRIVTCTPANEHRDLFHGLPNSYGTLGYALKLSAHLTPVKPFVALEHRRYADPAALFAAMAALVDDTALAFLDAVAFARDVLVLTQGRFADVAQQVSDYTYEHIYYRSLLERATDSLTVRDFLWRWDTDWFWCSKNFGAQRPWLRRLLGPKRLNSVTYQRIMRWNSRWKLGAAWERMRGIHAESVIQDVDIPLEGAAEFLAFLHAEVGILPIWLCPLRVPAADPPFPLYPLQAGALYINFGFWDRVASRQARPPGHVNRKIERKVSELRGLKSLYSDSYFTPDEFWSAYRKPAYDALKERYDPEHVFGDLYAKCVLRR